MKWGANLFLVNLTIIGAAGVAACMWVIGYTSWFPAIGGVLALGGAFSWVAFISGVLSDERKAKVQSIIAAAFLDNMAVTFVVPALVIIGGLYAAGTASVAVVSLQETPALLMRYDQERGAAVETLIVDAHGEQRFPVHAGLGATRLVHLRVQGLPDLTLGLRGARRASVQIPYSFMRPALLLRPTPQVYDALGDNPATLHIAHRGREWTLPKFMGQAVWVGCAPDVEVPQAVQDGWKAEASTTNGRAMWRLWKYPVGLRGAPPVLSVGDTVHAWITNEENIRQRQQRFVVRRVSRAADFPQVEDFDVANE